MLLILPGEVLIIPPWWQQYIITLAGRDQVVIKKGCGHAIIHMRLVKARRPVIIPT